MSPLSILSPRRLREAVVVTLGGLAGIAVDSAEVAESGSTLRAIETRGALLCGVDGGLAGFLVHRYIADMHSKAGTFSASDVDAG